MIHSPSCSSEVLYPSRICEEREKEGKRNGAHSDNYQPDDCAVDGIQGDDRGYREAGGDNSSEDVGNAEDVAVAVTNHGFWDASVFGGAFL